MKLKQLGIGLTLLGFGLLSATGQTVQVVSGDITVDTTWDSDPNNDGVIDTIYFFDQAIFVGDLSGATRPTLTIKPGTVIAGSGSVGGTNGLDVGSLVITRDGAINAEGTVEKPIVFTSYLEAEFLYNIDVNGDSVVNSEKPDPLVDGGDWGGVLILGNAPINFYDSPTNNVGEFSVEGFSATAAGTPILYGGDDPGDNSGILRYASIRFGGFEFVTDREINGLTMGGVGAGTTIDHVEVVANTDDGFEWFGGSVNTKNLVALYCQDDSFDLDEGHQGVHQFLFALQSNQSDHGSEADGGNRSGTGVKTGDPLTLTKFYNVTIVSAPQANTTWRLKDNFAGQFNNSIFTEIGGSIIRLDDADTAGQVGIDLNFTNNIFSTPGAAPTTGFTAEADALLNQTGNLLNTDPLLASIVKDGAGQVIEIDPRPSFTSPARNASLTEGAIEGVTYRGAFGNTLWTDGWTYASQEGYIVDTLAVPTTTVEVVSSDITTDTTWDSDTNGDGVADKIYFFEKAIFVGDLSGATRPTLTIAPGTVIAGSGSAGGTNGLDVGTLIITRDGAINANGNVQQPIIFTGYQDAEYLYGIDVNGDSTVNTLKQDPILDGGVWGGVIILGNAPINFYDSPTNNVGEFSVEGFSATAGGTPILYGGNDANDSSGVFRYVSLRFGGFEFVTDEEINGLTMGGVGAKTTIEFVEVVGNTDDGFEWFGGNVNTNNLVSLYCQDDSFDFDEGHQGTHQFFFALQSNESDFGTEADGGNKSGSGVKTGEPLTLTQIFNATFISAPGAAPGFRLKDNFAGQFHNSIFTEMNTLVRIDDADTAGQVGGNLLFNNNIFGTARVANINGNQPSEEADLLAQTGNLLDTDAEFLTLVKDSAGQVVRVDPRPALTGPAWGNPLTTGARQAANYRGAFGVDNWARTWTYLSSECILVDSFLRSRAIEVVEITEDIATDTTWTSDADGDGILDRIYFFSKAIFVGDLSGATRPTLTIEPGTVIAGSGSAGGTNGLDVGSLIITRDGRIHASGTPTNPIIFTAFSDAEFQYGIDVNGDGNIESTELDPITDGGVWGGLLVLGNAPINYYDSPTNNVGEFSVEGFSATAGGTPILYGRADSDPKQDSNDDSGVVRYVSLRFGGFEFVTDQEINGLTMGGLGAETVIEYVEVVGNTDDGFEWFGGTISTNHLFALYCQDDSFDFDEGHTGKHQFLFALQSNESDHGTEADGGNKGGSGIKTGTPLTTTQIFNATFVAAPTANTTWRLKDNFAGQFHNGIFTNAGGSIFRVDDADTAGQVGGNLRFTYNLFGPAGNGAPNSSGSFASAGDDILALPGNVLDVDAKLGSVVKDASGQVVSIDPRPFMSPVLADLSPAWGSELLAGAPQVVDYRGAFGKELWTATWTYGSEKKIVVPCSFEFSTPEATIVVEGGEGIEIVSTKLNGANFEVTFKAEANTTYQVKSSLDLTSFPTVEGSVTTDASGNGFAIVPANVAKKFVRIEE